MFTSFEMTSPNQRGQVKDKIFSPTTRMSISLHLLILILMGTVAGDPQEAKTPDTKTDVANTFLTMAWQVAHHLRPKSSCYVCGLMPYTAGEGLPLMALPASDCDTCRLMHVQLPTTSSPPRGCSAMKMRPLACSTQQGNCNRCIKTPKAVPILVIPQKFTWCLENDGHTPVGRSDCIRTFKWGSGETKTDWKQLVSVPHRCMDAAGETRFKALARRTADCSISSPVGMYWVCGNLAYPYLPVDYNGRCGLGYVVPAMRVLQSLPNRPVHRVRRGASDVFGTHYQSPFKNALGTLLPFYGIMSALDQIADLSHTIEAIANATGRALTLLSNELSSLRLLALQNRAALDFLLAAQGGTCAVIGSECCTFVPDYNVTIHEIVSHLQDTAKSVHQDQSSLFDFLKPAFASLSFQVIKVLIILVVLIMFLSFFVACMKRFLCNMS